MKAIFQALCALFVFSLLTQCATIHSKSNRLDERLISETELLNLIKLAQEESSMVYEIERGLTVYPQKSWTIFIYMAADNDLHYFAWRNLKQMEAIGSNENINIVVQLNTPGANSKTKRYIVKQGKRLLVDDDTTLNKKLNSGNPYTLIDGMRWTVEHYPADNYAMVLWNHGSGEYDPNFTRTINPCDLFYVNPSNGLLEIDRGTSYLALICQEAINRDYSNGTRGICFDDSFRSYISNKDLEFALHEISSKILNGNKLNILGFDACLMSMIGIASVAKNYVQYMVSSQEVEYGTGWDYSLVLMPFLQNTLTPQQFASHIVNAYDKAYGSIINDYTMSALDLSLTAILEQNINTVAYLLITALNNQNNRSVSDLLRKCKSTQYCTCFDEPTYIDLSHFYQNILQHIKHINLKDKLQEVQLKETLAQQLQQGILTISQFVIANKAGQKLKGARGISVYFPEHSIAPNYLQSPFALTSNWGQLLARYIFG